ncbi:hypothetical protein ASC78_06295 [Variovorax sp. Root318D1]|jgi:hypothetical protein|uniref:DUF3613 domain-containing protein n=1 Tax=Variovorax sp. Root318D1 TaxID=1736513 RepID=UPI0006FE9A3F|nr:DUF3613 domain-containing protein [Variovorax sp. Root318D1]KQU84987.1 hypothetical protein ASC78_06295 [Variovorax sp. Root318D1]
MNHESTERITSLPVRAALAAALLFMAMNAFAQTNTAKADDAGARAVAVPMAAQPVQNQATLHSQEAQTAEAEELDPPPLRLGDATQNLLAWQRSGEIASPTPRPIAGNVASRSYERYVKSFEHPIPEHLGSTVTKSNGAAGGAAGGAR